MPSVCSSIDSVATRAKRAIVAHQYEAPFSAESFEFTVLAERNARRKKPLSFLPKAPRRRTPPIQLPAANASQPAVSAIISSVRTSLVLPALRAETVEQFYDIVSGHFAEFVNAMEAIKTVRRATGDEPRSDYSFMDKYVGRIGKLFGEDAEEELRFDLATMKRASALVRALAPGEMTSAESDLARDFQVNVAMHTIGIVLLMDLCCEAEYSKVGYQQAFELSRGCALRAYAAVRQAHDLRSPPPVVEMGSGDDIE
jgi:hypothetical protein